MRLRHLFYLLLALPLVFAACQEPVEPAPSAAVLTLTSASVVEFTADGGEATITYTIENPVQGAKVEATCDAQWVVDLTVGENITFVVEANESTAKRETKVEVAYNALAFEVTVKQAAADAPVNTGVQFEAQYLIGEYYGDFYSAAGNYYIFFTDNGFDEDGFELPNSTYYRVDLYGALFEGDGAVTLPVGEYTLDKENTLVEGTFSTEYSCYWTTDAYGEPEGDMIFFDAGKLVVTSEGVTLNVTIDGEEHTVTFAGEAIIEDCRVEKRELEVSFASAVYYGDSYAPGYADNFYLFLSDKGWDANGWELPNATYYRFDIYTDVIDATEGLYIPYGTYTFDMNDSCEPGTFSMSYSGYYIMDDEAWDYVTVEYFAGGTVTISEEGVVAEIRTIGGDTHVVTYSGAVTDIIDGSSFDDDDDNEFEGPYSTLEDDWYCNLSDHTLYYEYYSDYYEVGYMNWMFAIMPNDGEGDFVQFDVLADVDSYDNFFGEYTISNSMEAFTAYPGYLDDYLYGSWYYKEDGVTMAPFVDGDLEVTDNGDGTVSVTFDVYDDCDFNIVGSWTGEAKPVSAMPATRSSNVFSKAQKVTTVKSSSKSRIECKGGVKSVNFSKK